MIRKSWKKVLSGICAAAMIMTSISWTPLNADAVEGDVTKKLVVEEGQSVTIPVAGDAEMSQGPTGGAATAELRVTAGLCDHKLTSTASSIDDSFNSEVNEAINLEEAEFIFNASGEEGKYQIYNETTNKYLTNTNANSYFSTTAEDMQVTSIEKKFRICKSDGNRYLMFYFAGMNFNGNSGGYNSSMNNGTQELVLLEKKAEVAESDVVPGYKQAISVADGEKYLIAHIWSDGRVLVLYPTNGVNPQTKLVSSQKKQQLTITGVSEGTATCTVGTTTYEITVTKPLIRAALSKATAGSWETAGEDGKTQNAIDGSTDTYWHSRYNGNSDDNKQLVNVPQSDASWFKVDLRTPDTVYGVSYLPRQAAANGTVKTMKVQIQRAGSADWKNVDVATVNGAEVTTGAFGGGTSDTNPEGDGYYFPVCSANSDLTEKKILFTEKQEHVAAVRFWIKESYGNGGDDVYVNAAEFDVLVPGVNKIESASLSLDGKIGVNFYAQVMDADADNVAIVLNGTSHPMSDSVATITEDGFKIYKFTTYRAAKEMAETNTAALQVSGSDVSRKELSVRDYADVVLAADSPYSDALKNLVKAMVNYGAYSEVKFNKNTSATGAANENLSETDKTAMSDAMAAVTADTIPTTGKQVSTDVTSVSLVLESDTALRFFLADSVAVTGSDLTEGTSGDGHHFAAKTNIAAKDLDQLVTVTTSNDNTVAYSPLIYAQNVLAKSTTDVNLQNVVKALYLYSQAAEAYFQ